MLSGSIVVLARLTTTIKSLPKVLQFAIIAALVSMSSEVDARCSLALSTIARLSSKRKCEITTITIHFTLLSNNNDLQQVIIAKDNINIPLVIPLDTHARGQTTLAKDQRLLHAVEILHAV